MILDFNIFSGSLTEIINKRIINTINPYSYIIALQDNYYRKALKESDLLLPDGIGIVWALKFLGVKAVRKISGYDVFIHLMELYNKRGGKILFVGSTADTLKLIKSKALIEYPRLCVNFYEPPFKESFSQSENDEIISFVNSFCPDVLFVGMTAPKQEKWVCENKNKINARIIASVGAVFDFYAGTIKRPSKFWINLGLEWFFRFLQEPRRLWRRNFIAAPLFIWEILKIKIKN